MRLCQPYFRALARSFAAGCVISGVMAGLWIIALYALARLIDAQLAHAALSELTPLLAVPAIAMTGALVLQHARDTLLQRRRIWLEHALGEAILAHELWRGSEQRQLTRSMAAVEAVATFIGGRSIPALTEAPWALAIAGALWSVNEDIAAVVGVAALLLLALAFGASRIAPAAHQFDISLAARMAGGDIIGLAALDSNASLAQARTIAGRWETSQRVRVGNCYTEAQAASRRATLVALIRLTALGAIVLVACAEASRGGASAGSCVSTGLVAAAVLRSLSHWSTNAGEFSIARAAARHLSILKLARPRNGETKRLPITVPDLRAPLAAGLFATVATAAGLAGVIAHWHLPMPPFERIALPVHATEKIATTQARLSLARRATWSPTQVTILAPRKPMS